MNFWEKITGSDMTNKYKNFEARTKNLPKDYQVAWEEVQDNLWIYSDFTGRNLIPILEGVLEMFEETSANGQSIKEVLGEDIKEFCTELIGEDSNSFEDKWRKKLNSNIAKKLGK